MTLCLARDMTAQDPVSMITVIEGPQVPNRGGFDSQSLLQMMERLRVPA